MGIKDAFKKIIGVDENEFTEEFTPEEIEAMTQELREQEAAQRAKETQTVTQPAYRAPSTFTQMAQADIKVEQEKVEQRMSVTGTNAFKLVVIEPKDFNECPKLVDSLKGRRPIIINLEKIETETAKKIFDFLSGATYALNGKVQKIANNIFVFSPASVDIIAQKDKTYAYSEAKTPW